jgi:hypothetical protein
LKGGRALVVMARWPAPGRCKCRLAAGIGRRRAAAVQRRLCLHTCAVAREARRRLDFELALAAEGLAPASLRRWAAELGCDLGLEQGPGSLGLVGSDLPSLTAADLERAFGLLEEHPLVLGPAADGGYWLIGLNGSWPALFCGIPWGSDQVLPQTTAAAAGLGIVPRWLSRRGDIDRPADLSPWR